MTSRAGTAAWVILAAVSAWGAGCGSGASPPTDGVAGAGGSATTTSGSAVTTSTTSGQGGGGGCPFELPEAGSVCDDDALSCDYGDACNTRAVCASSYEDDTYGELTWQHHAADDGAPCAQVGTFCAFANAFMDSLEDHDFAVCTAEGWISKSAFCDPLDCGDCPSALPVAGEACTESTDTTELAYAHCAYPAEDTCGWNLARIDCVEGAWAIDVEGCGG